MEKEKYQPTPTDKIHAIDYTEENCDKRWNEQIRYIHGMIDSLYCQNVLTDKMASCMASALGELFSCYNDVKHSIRIENHK